MADAHNQTEAASSSTAPTETTPLIGATNVAGSGDPVERTTPDVAITEGGGTQDGSRSFIHLGTRISLATAVLVLVLTTVVFMVGSLAPYAFQVASRMMETMVYIFVLVSRPDS